MCKFFFGFFSASGFFFSAGSKTPDHQKILVRNTQQSVTHKKHMSTLLEWQHYGQDGLAEIEGETACIQKGVGWGGGDSRTQRSNYKRWRGQTDMTK